MKLNLMLVAPAVLALGLLLAACDTNTTPPAPTEEPAAEDAAAEAEAAAAADEAEAAADEAEAAAAAAAAAAEAEAAAAEAEAAAAAEAEAAAAAAAEAEAAAAAAAEAEAAAAAAAEAEAAAASTEAMERGAANAAAAVAVADAEPPAPVAPMLPAAGLRPDTLLAVNASNPGLPYLGVWAPDATACGTVDQPGATGYAVITPLSVRQGDDLVLVNAAPLESGSVTLTAGETSIELALADDSLTVGSGAALVRCTQ